MQAILVARKRRTLANVIRSLLDEQGKTVSWLAGEVGITRAAASRIVNGQVVDPSISIVQRIAEAFGVSVSELLDEEGR